MGRVGDDARVLDVAERIEKLFDWQHPHASHANSLRAALDAAQEAASITPRSS